MIVVDTSVWIDVLNERDSPQAVRCVELIEAGHLRAFPVLRLDGLDDFALAAELYRCARRAGVTIRKTLDCLIAAPCVRTGAPILHADADFDRLADCTPLRLYT